MAEFNDTKRGRKTQRGHHKGTKNHHFPGGSHVFPFVQDNRDDKDNTK